MRDLGSRAAMRWGSSPHARTTSEQTALHCVPRQSRGTFVPLRLFLLFKTATAALGCGFVFWGARGACCAPLCPAASPRDMSCVSVCPWGRGSAGFRCAPRLRRGTCAALRLFLLFKTATAALGCDFVFWGGKMRFAVLRFGLARGAGCASLSCLAGGFSTGFDKFLEISTAVYYYIYRVFIKPVWWWGTWKKS